jgi:preprotein translocase subunit SecA
MHVELVAPPSVQEGAGAEVPAADNVTTSGPSDAAPERSAMARPIVTAETKATASALSTAARSARPSAEDGAAVPVVRSDWEKTPRNAPCPCGSGKKFKLCHGR